MSEAQKAWVYIVECADNSLYTGWTYDVAARVARHNSGLGAKYTRTRLPVRLVYQEELEDKIEAMRREWHLKRLTRAQKQRLIAASCAGAAHHKANPAAGAVGTHKQPENPLTQG